MSSPGLRIGVELGLGWRDIRAGRCAGRRRTCSASSNTKSGNNSRRRCARRPCGRFLTAPRRRRGLMMPPLNSASRKPAGPADSAAARILRVRNCSAPIAPISCAALTVLIGIVAALEPLEIAHGAIEIATHLLDLRGDRPALRRLAGNSEKKPFPAAPSFRLHLRTVEVGLLLGDGVFGCAGSGRRGWDRCRRG